MAELLERSLYRKIKRMDRKALEALLQDFYNMGAESVANAESKPDAADTSSDTVSDTTSSKIDLEALKTDIGKIKGIGATRINEIMAVIAAHLDPEN